MPAECSVPGCDKYEEARAKGVIFHRFPEKDVELCKRWLAAIGRDVNTPQKNYVYLRVCSQHFTPDDYERDLKAELMGCRPKLVVKKTAIPSLLIRKKKAAVTRECT
uniref:THAP-type domain-containing protein n=1 Tax=Pygocentrus nattereri TaxID=42514 RepID=A0AAR2JZD4_PYGNA